MLAEKICQGKKWRVRPQIKLSWVCVTDMNINRLFCQNILFVFEFLSRQRLFHINATHLFLLCEKKSSLSCMKTFSVRIKIPQMLQ